MAHKVKKIKAFKLFFKGWGCPEVADQIAINIRTCQRWHKEFLEQNPDFAAVGKVPVSVIPIDETVSTFPTEAIENASKHTLSFSEDWTGWANSLTNNHLQIHAHVREKLFRMLDVSLNASEFNTRAINILSQSLCRHLQAERETGFVDMLITEKACQRIEKLGYEISFLSNPNTDELNDS